MVLVLAKIFRFVVLARLLHLKNEKLINVELKSSLLKTEEANDYLSLVAEVKQSVTQDVTLEMKVCVWVYHLSESVTYP